MKRLYAAMWWLAWRNETCCFVARCLLDLAHPTIRLRARAALWEGVRVPYLWSSHTR